MVFVYICVSGQAVISFQRKFPHTSRIIDIYTQSEVLKTGLVLWNARLIYSHAVVFVYTCVSGQAVFSFQWKFPHTSRIIDAVILVSKFMNVVYFPKPHVNRNSGLGEKKVM